MMYGLPLSPKRRCRPILKPNGEEATFTELGKNDPFAGNPPPAHRPSSLASWWFLGIAIVVSTLALCFVWGVFDAH